MALFSTGYASRADAQKPYTAVDWRGDWALIIGSEAHGLSRSAQNMAQRSISIPMSSTESLNAAAAAAVMLFEARRQRLGQIPADVQN